jgi:DNA (cytosine-5)-methyltransferase 1
MFQPKPEKTFCEFFAGIGLVREGLLASGWSCLYANDISAKKQTMYEAYFGGSNHFHLGDVWKTEEVLERIIGRPFLATASFPCIDLSLAGHYRGFGGEHSSSFFGFVNVLRALGDRRPPLVMLENVTGFLTARKGGDFAEAAKTLAGLGYWIDALVLDAKHFVPQSRPRIFLIGAAEGLQPPGAVRQVRSQWAADAWRVKLTASPTVRPPRLIRLMEKVELATGWIALDVPAPPSRQTQLADVVDLDDEQEWWNADEVQRHYAMMSDRHKKHVDDLLAAGGKNVGAAFRRGRNRQQRAEVRFDGLAGCLRTPRGGSAKQILIFVDGGRLRMRWMSAREYARLQGAENFPLDGDNMQLLFGFGDAVCVPVIRWIDAQVLTPIFDEAVSMAVVPTRVPS